MMNIDEYCVKRFFYGYPHAEEIDGEPGMSLADISIDYMHPWANNNLNTDGFSSAIKTDKDLDAYIFFGLESFDISSNTQEKREISKKKAEISRFLNKM